MNHPKNINEHVINEIIKYSDTSKLSQYLHQKGISINSFDVNY